MNKLLILYYSAVGNTKNVADLMFKKMSVYIDMDIMNIDIFSIENLPSDFNIGKYSCLIVGFPTFHSQPAKPIMRFFKNLSFKKNIPAFIFTTCGLYSENSVRTFAIFCHSKGITPIFTSSYRCAATDGILLTPFMKCWFTGERKLLEKIDSDCKTFIDKLNCHKQLSIPLIKWYTPLNKLNKLTGSKIRFKIYLHKNKCVKCKICALKCSEMAIQTGKDLYPVIDTKSCINCYRCIHHCPEMALSLSKNKTVKYVWVNYL